VSQPPTSPSPGHAILGTGVDIIETARVAVSLQKFGERFLQRCFWADEITYCQSMKYPALHLAARFAAKEALAKAFGTGIGGQLGWKDMEIRKRDSGQPYVVLHGKGRDLAASRGVSAIFVSLSHCRQYAAAHAVIVGAAAAGRSACAPHQDGAGGGEDEVGRPRSH
jgi:holo-[acyl-carrier protein] synthase